MRYYVIVPLLGSLLCGCSDPVADAERRAEIIANTGSGEDLCAAYRAVATAYLQKKQEDGYRLAKVRADAQCQSAELDRQAGYDIEPDKLEVPLDNPPSS